MKDLGITKGEWIEEEENELNIKCPGDIVIEVWHGADFVGEAHNVVKIVLDAGNTAQKCGLLPSELLKQRDELLRMLNSLMLSIAAHPDYVGGDKDDEWHTLLSIAEDLITKAEER
jgi:hypothetical protein